MVFAGASDLPRTKSTTRVSVNELRNVLADRADEYLVLDEVDINNMVDKKTESTRTVLSEIVAANPNKKVVLSYPLFLKELTLVTPESGPRSQTHDWKTGGSKEQATPYLTELMKIANNDENEAVRTWISSGGRITTGAGRVLEGPNPVGVAREYLSALKRLDRFTQELFPGRPRVVEATAHSWDIDVFIAYATHQGKLDVSAYDEIAKGVGDKSSIISEFEFPIIKFSEAGNTLEYRGRTYPINAPELASNSQPGDK